MMLDKLYPLPIGVCYEFLIVAVIFVIIQTYCWVKIYMWIFNGIKKWNSSK